MAAKSPADVFAEVMRQEREKRLMPREDVADKLGLHHNVIKDWETGVRAPRLSSAIRWAKIFDRELVLK